MTRRLVVLVVLAAVPVWSEEKNVVPKPGAVAAALKAKWAVVSAKFDGKESAGLKGRSLVFDDKEFTTYDGDKKGRTVSFTIDTAKAPYQIDLERGDDGAKALGIFAIDKDELKICYAEPGAERPTKFESDPDSKLFLLVLKRGK